MEHYLSSIRGSSEVFFSSLFVLPFVVDAKMATAQQKAFCVIEYGRSESTTVVQRAFRTKYGAQPPDRWCIKRWYKQFTENGCLCKITAAIQTVTPDMLLRVWNEFEYRIDIARVSGGGHIEHL